MKQESFFSKIWRVFTPLATYYVLQIIATIGVCTAFAMKFVGQADLTSASLESIYQSMMRSVLNSILDISFWCTVFSAAAVIPILLLFRKKDQRRADQLGKRTYYTRPSGGAYLIFLALACAASLAGNNMMLISGLLRDAEGMMDLAVLSQPVVMILIGMGIVSPVAEEMIFRVVMYDRVREYTRPLYAGILTSLLYASLHMGLVQVVYAFLMGSLFSYAYEKTHSWAVPVLMHVGANMMEILLMETDLFRFMFGSRKQLIGMTLFGCAIVVIMVYLSEVKVRTIEISETAAGVSADSQEQGEL